MLLESLALLIHGQNLGLSPAGDPTRVNGVGRQGGWKKLAADTAITILRLDTIARKITYLLDPVTGLHQHPREPCEARFPGGLSFSWACFFTNLWFPQL